MKHAAPVLAVLALAACQREAPREVTPAPVAAAEAPAPPAEPSDDWRDYATVEDVDRLTRLPGAWTTALTAAHDQGKARELVALGALVDPQAPALAHPHPGPGRYRCRTIKLGGELGLVSYGWFTCEVELTPGGDLIFRKLTGSQRPEGKLYPGEAEDRLVFLGTVAWGEGGPPAYGADPDRDLVGAWTRIGPKRWRLALPWPRVESDLDLIEIIPSP